MQSPPPLTSFSLHVWLRVGIWCVCRRPVVLFHLLCCCALLLLAPVDRALEQAHERTRHTTAAAFRVKFHESARTEHASDRKNAADERVTCGL
jgi:hypothetical protein